MGGCWLVCEGLEDVAEVAVAGGGRSVLLVAILCETGEEETDVGRSAVEGERECG
jgi:hypothetical protein